MDTRGKENLGPKRINLEQRIIIEKMLSLKKTYIEISHEIGKSATGVKQEVIKNGGKENYSALDAQKNAEIRNKNKIDRLYRKITAEELEKIKEYFLLGFSILNICCSMRISKAALLRIVAENKIDITLRDENIITDRDRLYSLEQQVSVLFDLIKGK